MKNIYLLGATGSIGTQTLDVLSSFPTEYRLVSLSVGKNIQRLEEIIHQFHPKFVSVQEEKDYLFLKKKYPEIMFSFGEKGLIEAATFSILKEQEEEDVVINAVVGMIGLVPTIQAIEHHRTVLLANKETLVVGGEIIMDLVQKNHVTLLPIDSEHSAILQCLQGNHEVSKLIITASGGAFRDKTREELKDVTIEDALKHPTWNMGAKITVDCATMANKGLEVMEAHYLFQMPYEQIETVLHPESIIHSMVEFQDGSVLAQLANPDMRLPIQYALTYPKKLSSNTQKKLDFKKFHTLTLKPMDMNRYPCLQYAYEAGKQGGIMPTVFNASNEEAVQLFIEKKISFLEIEKIIQESMKETQNIQHPNVHQIMDVDKTVRNKIRQYYDVERK